MILNRLKAREELLTSFELQLFKAKSSGRLDRLDWQSGLSIRVLDQNRLALVKAISRDLANQTYRFGIARRKLIRADKDRIVYEFGFIDRVVLATLARVLQESLVRVYSPKVYSYKRGGSNFQPVRSFARYLRRYNRDNSSSERFLGVWRFDVKSYSDSIDVRESSRLWTLFEDGLEKSHLNSPDNAYIQALFKQGLRPDLAAMDDNSFVRCQSQGLLDPWSSRDEAANLVGITTGSALVPIAANLYLTDLDRFLGRADHSFYARYGDDILFACPLGAGFIEKTTQAKEMLDALKLTPNPTKERFYELNGAGISKWAGTVSSEYPLEPKQEIKFLGWLVNHRGDILPTEQKLVRDRFELTRRLENHRRLAKDFSPPQIAGELVALTNAFRRCEIAGVATVTSFVGNCALNTKIRRRMDLSIARILSSTLTGIPSVRTFRHISWRQLREDFQLLISRKKLLIPQKLKGTPKHG